MANTIPTEGDLAAHPLPQLLLELHAARYSGELLLEKGRAHKTIAWSEGAPVSVESSLRSESLAATLVRAGRIDSEAADRVYAEVAERGCREASAVVGLQLLEAKDLVPAIKTRVSHCLVEAMAWSEGHFSLEPGRKPSADTRVFSGDVLAIVQRGLVTHWRADRLCSDLMEHRDRLPSLTEAGSQRLRRLGGDEQAILRTVALLDGKRPLETVIGAVFASPHALAALWTAQACGWIEYVAAEDATTESESEDQAPDIEIEVAGVAAAPSRSAAAPKAKREDRKSPKSAEVAKEVRELHESIEHLDHYAFIGVEPNASPAEIKKAYFKAAKRYHPDKLAQLGLEEIRDTAAEVFAHFAEAHEVLSNPERRASYDDALASGHTGADDIDIARLGQAETFYRKGCVVAKMGDFRGAAELFANAVELWPEECIYQANLGWALFKKTPPDLEAARAALDCAVLLDDANAQSHHWRGLVLRALGDEGNAAKSLARAQRLDPGVS